MQSATSQRTSATTSIAKDEMCFTAIETSFSQTESHRSDRRIGMVHESQKGESLPITVAGMRDKEHVVRILKHRSDHCRHSYSRDGNPKIQEFRELQYGPRRLVNLSESLSKLARRDAPSITKLIEKYNLEVNKNLQNMGAKAVESMLRRYMVMIDSIFFFGMLTSQGETLSPGQEHNPLVSLHLEEGTLRESNKCIKEAGLLYGEFRIYELRIVLAKQGPLRGGTTGPFRLGDFIGTLVHEMVHAFLDIFSDLNSAEYKDYVAPEDGHGVLFWELNDSVMAKISSWIPTCDDLRWHSCMARNEDEEDEASQCFESRSIAAMRSVASRHLELRGRQLDQYGKTSSIVRSWKGHNVQGQRHPGAPVARTSPEQPDVTTSQGSATNAEAVGVQPPGFESVSSNPIHETSLSERSEIYRELARGSAKQPIPEVPLTQSDQGRPGFQPANADDAAFHASINESAKISVTPTPPKPSTVEDDTPPEVDVNIFHTNRGASILDQQKDYLGKIRPTAPPPKPSWFKDFGHDKKEEKPTSPTPPETVAPKAEELVVKEDARPLESAPESLRAEARVPAEPVTPKDDTAIFTEISLDAPKAEEIPQPKGQGADQEHTEMVKEVLAQAEATSTPEAETATVASTTDSSKAAYVLRESKVPSSRLGRMWNYGSLAAGMLGGAISEGVSRGFGGGGSNQGSVMLSPGNMERLVAKLSQMRGAALKLGQIMSFQDSKMLPAPIQEVLQRVQDRADYMPAWQRDRVLTTNLGAEWRDLFSDFEEKPIAAASIGQVHRATLKSGEKVAVKIQFPGVADSINSDLDNLSMLLMATKMLPRGLYLNKTIDNARVELGWECDYVREAECGQRYRELLKGEEDVFVVPKMYPEACGKQVLTMEFMEGIGVTRVTSFTQKQRDWIGTQVLRLCLREITEFKFMQTDPNWTNFLYNAQTQKLELLDFGASREYPDEFVTQYVNLLAAASRTDRDTVKDLSEKLGYLTGHESRVMVDAHLASVLTLAEPFLQSAPDVYDFKDQTITERVKALIPVMIRERLAPPPEETYSLHRKLSGAFLLCARLGSKVRCKELFEKALQKAALEVER
ncbi:putative ABC1 atypical kinase-like domain-containing protein [Seiridium cardinale]